MPIPIQRRARDPLAQERPGQKPGGQGLKAGDQGRDPGRQPVLHRPEHAAEIEPVQQDAGDQAVAPIPPVARPGHPRDRHDDRKDEGRQHVADEQEGQRLGIGRHEPRDDEPGRPDEHEERRSEAGEDCGVHGGTESGPEILGAL